MDFEDLDIESAESDPVSISQPIAASVAPSLSVFSRSEL
jgi:hypothetical protein